LKKIPEPHDKVFVDSFMYFGNILVPLAMIKAKSIIQWTAEIQTQASLVDLVIQLGNLAFEEAKVEQVRRLEPTKAMESKVAVSSSALPMHTKFIDQLFCIVKRLSHVEILGNQYCSVKIQHWAIVCLFKHGDGSGYTKCG
jgi:hypothetical protein